jgi:cell division protein FtsN
VAAVAAEEAAPAEAAPTEVAAAEAPASDVALTASVAAGTHLIQLGAFDSAEIAASEWTRLQGQFGEFLGSRERVIQETQSGGRTFYRLRAQGFTDRADARRLCAALTAEGADCIPVTVD